MRQRPRANFSRGASMLAGVLLIGLFGIIAVGLQGESSAQGQLAQTAGAAALTSKVEGDSRCNQELSKAKNGPKGEVKDFCAPGCVYRIHENVAVTEVQSEDLCKSLPADKKQQCEVTGKCIVATCDSGGCRPVPDSVSKLSSSPEAALGKAAQVSGYFEGNIKTQSQGSIDNPIAAAEQLTKVNQDLVPVNKEIEDIRGRLSALQEAGPEDLQTKADLEKQLALKEAEQKTLLEQKTQLEAAQKNAGALAKEGLGGDKYYGPKPSETFTKPPVRTDSRTPVSAPETPPDKTPTQSGGPGGLGSLSGLLSSLGQALGKALAGGSGGCPSGQMPNPNYNSAISGGTQYVTAYQQDANGNMIPVQVAVQQPQSPGSYPSSQPCQPQTAPTNTCTPSYYCSGNNLMYHPNTCVDQVAQTCQYGCSGNACSPQNAGNSIAQISCSPKVVDPGGAVAISYACSPSSTIITSSGFPTPTGLSGSAQAFASTTDSSVAYAIACANQQSTPVSASCSVTINRAALALSATPNTVSSGGTASVAWVTTGTSSCTVSSPDLPAFTTAMASSTRTSGVATTPSITATSTIALSCLTLGGNTASTTVVIGVY